MAGRELYLVRHAIAETRGPEWPDDRQRPLTAAGIRRFKEVVRGLARTDLQLDLILTSPLTRAAQTARLLAELPSAPPLKLLEALAPGTSLANVLAAVARAARGHRIALVGHEPDLGHLAAALIGGRRSLAFKKGGIARIDLPSMTPPLRGSLVWFAPPKMLRQLR